MQEQRTGSRRQQRQQRVHKILTDATPNDDKGTGLPVAAFKTVQFSDRLTGYITGTNNVVLKTVDGGAHWKSESNGIASTGTPQLALSSDAQRGTLIGADGSVQTLNDQAESFNSRFWYDELGRLVLSQNAKQFTIVNYEDQTLLANTAVKTQGGVVRAYSYTLYDKIGRITEVGELLTDKAVVSAKNESQVQYATHAAYVGGGYKHQVSKTTYDINETPPAGFTPTYLRNRVAYTTYQQEQNKPLQATHYSYDVHGNVNRLLQVITHDGNVLAKTVDYEYDLISGKVNKVYYQKGKADQLIHRYAYDGDNRITKVETSTDSILFTKEASYEYYAHGPLARTKTGELNVETQNYAYTVQGWIKQMQAEAFGYALGYNEKDYTSIGASTILATPIAVANTKSKGLYNGNIASMTSKTPVMPTPQLQQQYSYDQLNRITGSNTPGAGNNYRTGYTYDANGNIKSLSRYDDQGAKFDTLAYNYETKAKGYLHTTNKLRWVDDAPQVSLTTADIEDQSADNYSYDAIGNLIKDNQEEIDTIQWTVSGKVKRVIRIPSSSKPNLEFEYDASGQRIVKKVIRKDGTATATYYLRDASGNVMSVYSYNTGSDNDPALTEQYLYGSSRIGVYTPTANVLSKTRNFGRKSYELSDHLGNVRATLSDYRRLASQAQVQSATDYYPFGMVARSYSSSVMPRHQYNGKEVDAEGLGGGSSTYDYGMRIYNPNIARFLSIDPIGSKYPWYTPYQFAGNTPIQAIDIEGLEPESMIDKTGKLTAPMVSVLSAAFTWEKASLQNATWVPYTANIKTEAWAMMVGIPDNTSASVMGTTVVHDNDQNRSDKNWFKLISHEQSHEHDIYHYGNGIFYTEYVMEGMMYDYEDITTEYRAHNIGGRTGQIGYAEQLLNYKNGSLMGILNDPNKTLEQKSQEAESLGARFRRDVLLTESISYYNIQLTTAQTKLTAMENAVGPGAEPRREALKKQIEKYQTKIATATAEQKKITETYGQ